MRYSTEATIAIKLIIDDVMSGTIPPTIRKFAELHEHVDANEYLIEAVPFGDENGFELTDAFIDRLNNITAEIDMWLMTMPDVIKRALTRPLI